MIKQFENAQLLPVVVDYIRQGHTVTLPLKGNSMRPFLRDGRDMALLDKPDGAVVGDPVLAEIAPGHYVLHRIIAIDGNAVTLLGDGNITPEHCTTADIRALAKGFYRKGRKTLDPIVGVKWRVYSKLWTRLVPLRPYLLRIDYKLDMFRSR